MPLIKCPACGKDVSTQATSCPNCGHPLAGGANKARSKSSLGGLLTILGGIIALTVAVTQLGNATTEQNASCRADWIKCADNEQLVNQYSAWSRVQVECEMAANDQAKYGSPDWPRHYFGSFYKGNNYVTSGVAVAIEPDAQFSNGYGAMVHSRVTCTYDLRTKQVSDVDISPRYR
jgi:hypothetical protein